MNFQIPLRVAFVDGRFTPWSSAKIRIAACYMAIVLLWQQRWIEDARIRPLDTLVLSVRIQFDFVRPIRKTARRETFDARLSAMPA